MIEKFVRNDRQKELLDLASKHRAELKESAEQIDKEARIPDAIIASMKDSGFTSLPIPEEFGGKGLSLYELVLIQEELGKGEGAGALSIGWHFGILKDLQDRRPWNFHTYKGLCKNVLNGALVNRAQTEEETGDPTRGGLPATIATEVEGGYQLTGRKTFTTLSPHLDSVIVKSTLNGVPADFLVSMNQEGVSLEQTWEVLGMRGTRSDDLVLKDVFVPSEALLEIYDKERKTASLPPAWLLHIPAVYLGIAESAREEAVKFVSSYQPNSLDIPLKDVPHIQDKFGRISLALLSARHFLYSVAEQWDQYPEERMNMQGQLFAAKTQAVKAAMEAVDLSMRIVGGRSLMKKNQLERLYRDVRAGLHNPPSDELTLQVLAMKQF
ncbi:acyl-CoA dehydrogenase family protein [Pseudalkalibacillus hwajinpoensis]|uniref:acyl-CoA dehydrogenase family protein n=1 Tax=Guptibacillus hwajinpoensis TaxID=208199 RepID=UPI001CD345F0|nr:acyl-CoA dehydrogenase family protein [Pseudalkalibacillus hwajinpoensis]MCA0990384.1 acyl-CoA/acyl-ACP dehydrogenase [Pseudalkalibacillus hwajinpoensis]